MIDVQIAAAQSHERLTVFPLVSNTECELPYELLTDALVAGTLKITEVGTGNVPQLRAINSAATEVLIVDGEQLVGARQNRMTSRSILLPGHSDVEIPVSCMEQGRWHMRDNDMKPTPSYSPSTVRKHARVTEAQQVHAGRPAVAADLSMAQGDVWSSIHDYSSKLNKHSDTSALNELYDALPPVELLLQKFERVPNQIGVVVFHDNAALGMDIIGGRTLYARLHARFLTGYAMDARSMLDAERQAAPVSADAQRFLDQVRAAQRVESPSVGRGSYQVLIGHVVGGELIDGESVAHLSAFPNSDVHGREQTHVAEAILPPSRRRRIY